MIDFFIISYEPYFVYDISQRFCAHMKHTIKKPSMCMFMRSQNLKRDGLVFNVTIGHDADRQYCTRLSSSAMHPAPAPPPHALSQAAGLCAFTLRLQSFGKALGRLLLVSRGRS